jgi:transcriptional regulator with XRE-family HTH domain
MEKINEINIKIKNLREKKGLSQERFGGKVGVSGKSISAYENGRCMPPVRVLENICRVYNTSVFYLGNENKENLAEIISEIKQHVSKIEEILGSGLSV